MPFRARYVAYAVGAIVFVLLQVLQRRLGIGLGFFSFAYSLLATVGLTRLVLSVVNPDRPLGGRAGRVRARGLRAARGHQGEVGHDPPGSGARCPLAPGPGPPPRRTRRTSARGLRSTGAVVSGRSGLALRRISGHCTVTAQTVMAWYLLDPQGWSFRPDGVREQLIVDGADVLAQLAKRELHLRVTTRPYPVGKWARDHDANAPAPLPAWREHLITDQHRLSSLSMADKEVYLGVAIPSPKPLVKALGSLGGSMAERGVAALGKQVRATDELMASPGIEARRRPRGSWSGCCTGPARWACRRR